MSTLQTQLALAVTTAGSQRNLAKLLGITHQKLGRWLREGEPKGIKQIPAEAAPIVNAVYDIHKNIAKEQSKIDRLPFDPKNPVFWQRPLLRNGQPGERIFATNTQYIRPEIRNQIFSKIQKTGQSISVSVRSTVDLYSYLKAPSATPSTLTRAFKIRGAKDNQGRTTLLESYKRREQETPGKGYIAPVYTTMTDFRKQADPELSLNDLNFKLTQKHEPHAISLADMFLIQTTPGQYDRFNIPQTASTAREIKKRASAKQTRASLKRK